MSHNPSLEEHTLEPQFSELQVLVDLGLTLKQSRVYLALAKVGPSRIMEISKNSKVARPDVYSALEKLNQIGLVENIIEKPRRYKATPLKKGLSVLFETKTRQYEKLKAETEILRNTIEIEKPDRRKPEISQFFLIPKGTAVIDRIRNAVENAQRSIDLVVSWKRFSVGIASIFAEAIEKAWAKKPKIRFLIENPPKNKTAREFINFCQKPFCKTRFSLRPPETIFGVYDRKEIFIIVDPKTDLTGSPALWSNNPSLITLAEDFFEVLWLTAIENSQL